MRHYLTFLMVTTFLMMVGIATPSSAQFGHTPQKSATVSGITLTYNGSPALTAPAVEIESEEVSFWIQFFIGHKTDDLINVDISSIYDITEAGLFSWEQSNEPIDSRILSAYPEENHFWENTQTAAQALLDNDIANDDELDLDQTRIDKLNEMLQDISSGCYYPQLSINLSANQWFTTGDLVWQPTCDVGVMPRFYDADTTLLVQYTRMREMFAIPNVELLIFYDAVSWEEAKEICIELKINNDPELSPEGAKARYIITVDEVATSCEVANPNGRVIRLDNAEDKVAKVLTCATDAIKRLEDSFTLPDNQAGLTDYLINCIQSRRCTFVE